MRIYPSGEQYAGIGNNTTVVSGDSPKNVVEVWYVSSETKPTTGIANGSVAIEIDTSKVFLFNETSGAWVEVQ